jgi:urease accessory protein
MTTSTSIRMSIESDWLLRLSAWLSPSYPVGAFSYSHGLEWAVEANDVANPADLADYIDTALAQGGGWSDLVLFAAAWRAASDQDAAQLDEITELAWVLRGTGELALEATQQGAAFVRATCAAWPGTKLDALAARHPGNIAYPIAVAVACADRVPLIPALTGFAHGFAANLVSAGIRLIPLGQTDGQRVLAALSSAIPAIVARAADTPLDELGTASPGIDLASMRHETQYTRLFRS